MSPGLQKSWIIPSALTPGLYLLLAGQGQVRQGHLVGSARRPRRSWPPARPRSAPRLGSLREPGTSAPATRSRSTSRPAMSSSATRSCPCPIRAGSLDLSLAYNSQDATNVGMGPGWRLNVSRRLAVNADGSVTFTDADGARHTFTNPHGQRHRHVHPPGDPVRHARPGHDRHARPLHPHLPRPVGGRLRRGPREHGAPQAGQGPPRQHGDPRVHRRHRHGSARSAIPPAARSPSPGTARTAHHDRRLGRRVGRRRAGLGHRKSDPPLLLRRRQRALIGWADPLTTSGSCPTNASHLTCLTYTGGLVTKVAKTQTVHDALGGRPRHGHPACRDPGRLRRRRRHDRHRRRGRGDRVQPSGAGPDQGRPARAPRRRRRRTRSWRRPTPSAGSASVTRKLGARPDRERTTYDAHVPDRARGRHRELGRRRPRAAPRSSPIVASSLGLLAPPRRAADGTDRRYDRLHVQRQQRRHPAIVAPTGRATLRTTTRSCYTPRAARRRPPTSLAALERSRTTSTARRERRPPTSRTSRPPTSTTPTASAPARPAPTTTPAARCSMRPPPAGRTTTTAT